MAGGGENNGQSPLPNIVPPIFAPTEGSQSQNRTLRDSNKNLWHLKIEKVGDSWYFTDGWRKFVQDNNIEGGNTLLYEGSSQGLIDFKILGQSGSERGDGVKPLGRKNARGEGGSKTRVKTEDVDSDDEFEEKPTIHIDDHPVEDDGGHAKKSRKRRRNSDFYGGDIFSSGQLPVPLNPYFVTYPNQTRVNELYIPLDVIKSYNLDLPENLELVDQAGRKFYAKRKIWSDGRVLYYGGWKAICRGNLVQKNDKIICEFVGQGDEMQVKVSFLKERQLAK